VCKIAVVKTNAGVCLWSDRDPSMLDPVYPNSVKTGSEYATPTLDHLSFSQLWKTREGVCIITSRQFSLSSSSSSCSSSWPTPCQPRIAHPTRNPRTDTRFTAKVCLRAQVHFHEASTKTSIACFIHLSCDKHNYTEKKSGFPVFDHFFFGSSFFFLGVSLFSLWSSLSRL